MRAGRMRAKVDVYSVTQTQDVAGAPVLTQTLVRKIWGRRVFKSGDTRDLDDRILNIDNFDLIIRWMEIDTTYRIGIDGQIYDISAIDPVDDARRQLRLRLVKGD